MAVGKGRERGQSTTRPWRKEHLDRLDGNLPEARLRNRRNSCPWHIVRTQMSTQAHKQRLVRAGCMHGLKNKAVHCSPRADRDRRTKAVPQDGHRKHAVQKKSRSSLKWQTPFQTKSRNTVKRHFLFFFGERVNSWTGCFSVLFALPVSGAATAGESCRTCYHWRLFNGFTSELMLFKWSENRWIDVAHRSGATHNYRNRYKVLREVLRCRWVMEAISFSYGAFLAYWSQIFSAKLLVLCCQCPGRQWQLCGNLRIKSTRLEGVRRARWGPFMGLVAPSVCMSARWVSRFYPWSQVAAPCSFKVIWYDEQISPYSDQ